MHRLKNPHIYLIDHYRSRRVSLEILVLKPLKPDIEAGARDLFIFLYVF